MTHRSLPHLPELADILARLEPRVRDEIAAITKAAAAFAARAAKAAKATPGTKASKPPAPRPIAIKTAHRRRILRQDLTSLDLVAKRVRAGEGAGAGRAGGEGAAIEATPGEPPEGLVPAGAPLDPVSLLRAADVLLDGLYARAP